MLAVTGRAVARKKGYYPTPSGICDSVQEGQVFDVVEGHPVDTWADPVDETEVVEEKAEAPKPKPDPAPPAASKPNKRRQANAPVPDDIA